MNKHSEFSARYLAIIMLAVTAVGVNYFYAPTMILLTTFTLGYLSKGSRCK